MGRQAERAIQLFIADANASDALRVGGERCEFAHECHDDASDPVRCAEIYRALCADRRANIIFGPYSRRLARVAAPIAELSGDGRCDAREAIRIRAEDDIGAAICAERSVNFSASDGIARVVVAFESELTSLTTNAQCVAGVGVGDEQLNRAFGLPAHRRVFAGQGEREADGDFHESGCDFGDAAFDDGLAVWIERLVGENFAAVAIAVGPDFGGYGLAG